MIKIETVENGWLITDETDPEGSKRLVVECYEMHSINPPEKTMEAFCGLLWLVNDLIGPTTSRYSKHRVHISLQPGDKHDSQG